MFELILALVVLYLVIGFLLYWKDYKAQPMVADAATIYTWPRRYI